MTRAVVVALIVGLVAPARADRKTAQKYFRAGERAYRAQNFDAAAQNFEEAYKQLSLPEIAFSAAQAYRRQYRVDGKPGEVARALALYRADLAEVKQGGRVRDAADAISELQPEYDRLAAAGKLGAAAQAAHTRLGASIAFADVSERDQMKEIEDHAAAPETAVTVTIDDQQVPANDLVAVEPGTRVIRVRAAGYQPVERKVTAIAGHSDLVDIELQPQPARVTVRTEDGAVVIVDGRQVGVAPTGVLSLAPGVHLLAIAHRGREPAGHDLSVTRGQTIALEVPLRLTTRRKAVPWVTAGAGVLALGAAGATLAALHFDHAASADLAKLHAGDQAPAVLDSYDSNQKWRDRFVGGLWVTGSAAVVIGATAAWLYYFDRPSTEGVQVTPIASPTSTGAVISGHF